MAGPPHHLRCRLPRAPAAGAGAGPGGAWREARKPAASWGVACRLSPSQGLPGFGSGLCSARGRVGRAVGDGGPHSATAAAAAACPSSCRPPRCLPFQPQHPVIARPGWTERARLPGSLPLARPPPGLPAPPPAPPARLETRRASPGQGRRSGRPGALGLPPPPPTARAATRPRRWTSRSSTASASAAACAMSARRALWAGRRRLGGAAAARRRRSPHLLSRSLHDRLCCTL